MRKVLHQILVTVAAIFIAAVIFTNMLIWLIQPSQPKITKKTVLRIALDGKVVEYLPSDPLSMLARRPEGRINLLLLKKAILHAQEDARIQGICLEARALRAGWAQLEEIRQALQAFQQAGKFIVAYGDYYTQKAYYLASLADDIVLNPEGEFFLQGLGSTVFFYKSMMEKLDIKPEIFRVGRYKSAVEPYMRQDMSAESKYQSTVLLTKLYDHFLDTVAKARQCTPTALRQMADDLSAAMPDAACQYQLISQVGYLPDAESLIRNKLDLKEEESINYVSFEDYATTLNAPRASKKQVAVLVAEGVIVDRGEEDNITAKAFVEHIRAIKEDDNIKAVVLRINSPGGSALASSILWKELNLLKEKKPVVASLSAVAASGGYQMAIACNRIFAHPTTLTGSIGIFGLFFDANALLRNTLGITTDVAKTSPSADLFVNPGRPLSTHERNVIQKFIDSGYASFLEKVAQGRNLDLQAVEQVASGRVWPGQLAQEHGLIDELGGLQEAICEAATLASLKDDYTVNYWPKEKSLFEIIFNSWSVAREDVMWSTLQKKLPALKHLRELVDLQGVQARMPYVIID